MPEKRPEDPPKLEFDDPSFEFPRGPAATENLEEPEPLQAEAQVLFKSQSRSRSSQTAPVDDAPALDGSNASKKQPELVPLIIETELKTSTVEAPEDEPSSVSGPVKTHQEPVFSLNSIQAALEHATTNAMAAFNAGSLSLINAPAAAVLKTSVPAAIEASTTVVDSFVNSAATAKPPTTRAEPEVKPPIDAEIETVSALDAIKTAAERSKPAASGLPDAGLKHSFNTPAASVVKPASNVAFDTSTQKSRPTDAPANVPVRTNSEERAVTEKAIMRGSANALDAATAATEQVKMQLSSLVNTASIGVVPAPVRDAIKASIPAASEATAHVVTPFLKAKEEPKQAAAKDVDEEPASALTPANVPPRAVELKTTPEKLSLNGPAAVLDPRANPESKSSTVKEAAEHPADALGAIKIAAEHSKPPDSGLPDAGIKHSFNTPAASVVKPASNVALDTSTHNDGPADATAPTNVPARTKSEERAATEKAMLSGSLHMLDAATSAAETTKTQFSSMAGSAAVGLVPAPVREVFKASIPAISEASAHVASPFLQPKQQPNEATAGREQETKTAPAKTATVHDDGPVSALDAIKSAAELPKPASSGLPDAGLKHSFNTPAASVVKPASNVAFDTTLQKGGAADAMAPANGPVRLDASTRTGPTKTQSDGPAAGSDGVNPAKQPNQANSFNSSGYDPGSRAPSLNAGKDLPKLSSTASEGEPKPSTAKVQQDGPTTSKLPGDGQGTTADSSRGTSSGEQLKSSGATHGDPSQIQKSLGSKSGEDTTSAHGENRTTNHGELSKGQNDLRSASDSGGGTTFSKIGPAGMVSSSESTTRVGFGKSETSSEAGTQLSKTKVETPGLGKEYNPLELFPAKTRGTIDSSSSTSRSNDIEATLVKNAALGLAGKTGKSVNDTEAVLQGRLTSSINGDIQGKRNILANGQSDGSTNKGNGPILESPHTRGLNGSNETTGTRGSAQQNADNGLGKGLGLPAGDGQRRTGNPSAQSGEIGSTRTPGEVGSTRSIGEVGSTRIGAGNFTVRTGQVDISAEISATRIGANGGIKIPATSFEPSTTKTNPASLTGDTRKSTTETGRDTEFGARLDSRSLIPADSTVRSAHRINRYADIDHSGKRYLTGAELILIMSLGGISRVRHIDSAVKRLTSAEERSNALKLYDRLVDILSTQKFASRAEGKFPSGVLRAVVKLEDKNAAQRFAIRPSGSEIAVSALIALSTTARIRHDAFLSQFKEDQTLPIERFIDVPHSQSRPKRQIINTSAQAVRRILDGVDMLPPKDQLTVSPPAKSDEIGDGQRLPVNSQSSLLEEKQAPTLRRRHWVVGPGETLTGIAAKLFNDPNLGWLIADINAEKTLENWVGAKRIVEIQSRQSLNMPTPEEVNEFYRRLSKSVNADDLVTVIAERAIDLEVAESGLKVLFGNKPATCAGLPTVEIADDSAIDES